MNKCQIIRIDKRTRLDDDVAICLSNGEVLYYGGWWRTEWRRLSDKSIVVADFKTYAEYHEGTLVYKSGDNYELVNFKQNPDLTIVTVSKHEIPADCGGVYDFSYTSFNKASLNESYLPTKHIIINLSFNDGSRASIDASEDPVWLDAEPGMTVEHYTFKKMNIYNLL